MAYFESISAGRGALEGYNQALDNQKNAHAALHASMGVFANSIANAGSFFDSAKIREEALKYQRMRDLANDKQKAQALELQKQQAEQSMDFAKRNQAMNEAAHQQNLRLGDLKNKALEQANKQAKAEFAWLLKTLPSVKARLFDPNAKKRASASVALEPNKPETIGKEEFALKFANPMFRN
ncbi:hypothetical protein [Helicobacter acinonychis]|uniref:Uncharacterized protein n=1 Tax=Helicobacter acinonychis (strain Sheeba) TaxID=382638 RepID=Q17VI6_HELAH|nr:hypothetical protein [Helicobacter acinonychis]CAK00340.1 hypothetical protein Hac_1632 [Helicobacter acinonychis str. Sheeba]